MDHDEDNTPVVLVTGAAQRIGAAICRLFHQRGFRVIIHCHRSVIEASALAEEFNQSRPASARVLLADLGMEQQVTLLARQTLTCFNRLDILVNNAAAFYPTPMGEVTAAQWQQLMDSNLRAAFFLSQSLGAQIRDHRGSIVNLIDIYADKPLKNFPVYSIAKAGLKGMTRALAIELAPQARVNGVAPGAILWPAADFSNSDIAKNEDKRQSAIIQSTALGRSGTAEEIAATVYFLGVEASYITGQVISVDGGRRLNF